MKCPGCGLYHPPQYENCVSCGAQLSAQEHTDNEEAAGVPVATTERPAASPHVEEEKAPESLRRSKNIKSGYRTGIPTMLGVLVAITVILIFAGATIFFLTKPPDDQRLYEQGQKELEIGQYAFAVKTLNQALALRPKDAKVYLALARAYVGVDQVEKAWDCISAAQQLGAGVVEEPSLASDLANYYRQRGKYERAIELLRPLAKANIAGKKAELADLDALWGDEALRSGNVEQALRCWEEVRDLREGSRYGESEARLATIYQKLANTSASNKDDQKALGYLSKLNNIAQNSRNYEMASDIYERTGQLELAIDQLRKAMKLGNKNPVMEKKLSTLLERRGKELLDQGNEDAGLGYLQQAKDMNPSSSAATAVTLRHLDTTIEHGIPHISGEVWNSTEKAINSLVIKVELFDTTTSRTLWSKDQKLVDDFVPPLGAKESKPFEFEAGVPVKANGLSEFRVYLDGTLYKSYPIGKKEHETGTAKKDKSDDVGSIPTNALKPMPVEKSAPPLAPKVVPVKNDQTPETAPVPGAPSETAPQKGPTAEEKTMKDLEP